jgi:hypothetical protein
MMAFFMSEKFMSEKRTVNQQICRIFILLPVNEYHLSFVQYG